MDLKKVQTIQKQPKPKIVKNVQSFIKFTNYYQKFIRGFFKIAAPLTKVIKKKRGFYQKEKQQQVFKTLKKLFLTTPMLLMFNS